MNILNDIFNRSQSEEQPVAITSPTVVPANGAATPATRPAFAQVPPAQTAAALPSPDPTQIATTEPTPAAPQAAAPTVTNPWGFDEATMTDLAQRGFTPERLERISRDFDPASYGTPNRQWYESVVTKPAIPDEKRIRNARIAASIGDALGSIVEIAAVNGGALAKERRYEDSAPGRTEAKEKELRDLYQQQLSRYENGMYEAGMRDVIRGMDQHRQERAELGNALGAKRKMDQDQARFEATLRQREAEARQRQENWAADRVEEKRVNDANIKNNRERTAIARAAETRLSNSGSAKGKPHQIVISANPNDPQASKDSLGNLVRAVDVSTEELNNYYRMAIADEDFRKAHPELNLPALTDTSTPENSLAAILGGSSKAARHNAAEMANIAAIYAKERYYDPQWIDEQQAVEYVAPAFSGYSPVWANSTDDPNDFDNRYFE